MRDPLADLVLPWPPSVNHLYVHTRRGPKRSKRAKRYDVDVAAEVFTCRAAKRWTVDVYVVATFYPPDRRVRDLDNLTKALFDSLTRAHVWADDKQVVEQRLIKAESGHALRGKVRVQIYPHNTTSDG